MSEEEPQASGAGSWLVLDAVTWVTLALVSHAIYPGHKRIRSLRKPVELSS